MLKITWIVFKCHKIVNNIAKFVKNWVKILQKWLNYNKIYWICCKKKLKMLQILLKISLNCQQHCKICKNEVKIWQKLWKCHELCLQFYNFVNSGSLLTKQNDWNIIKNFQFVEICIWKCDKIFIKLSTMLQNLWKLSENSLKFV